MRAVVIVLHGLNAHALGLYGNEWIATPNLDALAAGGVAFDQHHADHPGDTTSLLTGRFRLPPLDEAPDAPDGVAQLRAAGVRCLRLLDLADPGTATEAVFDDEFTADGADLAEAVSAALEQFGGAARCLLWVECDRLVPPWDVDPETFAAYADPLEDDQPVEPPVGEAAFAQMVTPAPVLPEPWPDPPEGPIDADDPDVWGRLHNTFAAVLTEVDRSLGAAFARLRESGWWDDALILVTSAGGYPLGEHGVVGYDGPCLHEEATHVPLIIRLPAGAHPGRRVLDITQPADVLPTLAAFLGVPPPPEAHGVSLLGLTTGTATGHRPYAVFADELEGDAAIGLRSPQWAFHYPIPDDDLVPPETPRLYRKPDDAREVNDVRQQRLDWTEKLVDVLDTCHTLAERPGPLTLPPLPPDEAERPDPETPDEARSETGGRE